ncbi:MAG: hypothetical protein M5U34_46820 [Chloroflexi bacterium]|nr:hypothetical protein [Chloroflexota bacterium]
MHLVITTREDPPLSLPRLRVCGQLSEIRASDLRFTVEETAVFLQTMPIPAQTAPVCHRHHQI